VGGVNMSSAAPRFILVALLLLTLVPFAHATAYPGNGGTGFGGPVGNGTLTVTDNGSGTINFSFVPGTSFSGNALVLYVDTKSGGVNNTSTLTDHSDGGRT